MQNPTNPIETPEVEDYQVPYNLDAERAVLGAILGNNAVFYQVSSLLKPVFFYLPMHQWIYQRITERIENGEDVNPITLQAGWKEICEEKEEKYLPHLVAMATSLFNIPHYAQIVKDMYTRRQVIRLGQEAVEGAYDHSREAEEIYGSLLRGLEEAIQEASPARIKTALEVGNEILEELNRPRECYSTGLHILDKCMDGGLERGRLYCFCAEAKAGKTLIAGTVSYNLTKAGVKHLFVAAEMGSREIYTRMLSRSMGINPRGFRKQEGDDFKIQVAGAVKGLQSNLLFSDRPSVTFDELKLLLTDAVYTHKITGFVLDYWQLVTGKPRGVNNADHLSEVAQYLASFCKKHNVWCLTLAQVNREGEVFGSDGIKKAADQLYRLSLCEGREHYSYLEMLATRYTEWFTIGSDDRPTFKRNPNGLYFEEVH